MEQKKEHSIKKRFISTFNNNNNNINNNNNTDNNNINNLTRVNPSAEAVINERPGQLKITIKGQNNYNRSTIRKCNKRQSVTA